MSVEEQDSKPTVDQATVDVLMATDMAASVVVDAVEVCRNCAGRGGTLFGPCTLCCGSGRASDVNHARWEARWAAARAKSDEEDAKAAADAGACRVCRGRGQALFGPCSTCGGSDRVAGDAAPLR